ncbi:hypothetical protein B0H19DRAFT_1275591 [Mycena capillaripes]|nr:hypothetical protein B0H19DRAFT_1275591 [Mycena capillaripes]
MSLLWTCGAAVVFGAYTILPRRSTLRDIAGLAQSRWGADAHEFKPARWLEVRAPLMRVEGEVLGPYANLLAFFHWRAYLSRIAFRVSDKLKTSCAGSHVQHRILEMRVVLCEFVGRFVFSRPEDALVRIRSTSILLPALANGKMGAVF